MNIQFLDGCLTIRFSELCVFQIASIEQPMTVRIFVEFFFFFSQRSVVFSGARAKRQVSACVTDERTACPLLLVADYRFYNSMNSQSLSKTTGYLVSVSLPCGGAYNGHQIMIWLYSSILICWIKNFRCTFWIQIGQIDRIDKIYKNEAFGSCGAGLGFEIKEVWVVCTMKSLLDFTLKICLEFICYLLLN